MLQEGDPARLLLDVRLDPLPVGLADGRGRLAGDLVGDEERGPGNRDDHDGRAQARRQPGRVDPARDQPVHRPGEDRQRHRPGDRRQEREGQRGAERDQRDGQRNQGEEPDPLADGHRRHLLSRRGRPVGEGLVAIALDL
jgi:hypothetical protein